VTTLDYDLVVPPGIYVGTYYGTVQYTLVGSPGTTGKPIEPTPVQ
jgi:hypothetical protein